MEKKKEKKSNRQFNEHNVLHHRSENFCIQSVKKTVRKISKDEINPFPFFPQYDIKFYYFKRIEFFFSLKLKFEI